MMILTLIMEFSTLSSLQGKGKPSSGFQQSVPHLLMVMLGLQSAQRRRRRAGGRSARSTATHANGSGKCVFTLYWHRSR